MPLTTAKPILFLSVLLAVPSWTPRALAQANPVATKPAAAEELPTFRPGWWEYRRTLQTSQRGAPQVTVIKRCVDPSSDIKQKMGQLKQKGCVFSRLAKAADRYTTSGTCQATGGKVSIQETLTASNADSYKDESQTRRGDFTSRSTILAHRLGECPTPAASPPGGTK
jgi:hypothetical protein